MQLPTTLLAQVDASVGGKTGVNHAAGKNLIGAFHQPRCVLADLDTLASLPEREYRSGLAEVIKHALIADAALFDWLEGSIDALLRRDLEPLAHAVEACCRIKAAIVAEDERESGQRALLNLGHTFAHALETATGYDRWLHGEAVAIGLTLAAHLAHARRALGSQSLARIEALIAAAGLPCSAPGLEAGRLLELMGMDKKVRAGRIRLVLPRGLGRSEIVEDASYESILTCLEHAVSDARTGAV